MSAYDLLTHNPDPTDAEIRQGISGNLCRCTGYVKQIDAIRRAAAIMRESKMSERPEEGFAIVGTSARKVDGIGLVTGKPMFVADLQLPGTLHVKILGSPFAHARIVSIDTREAEEHPGVACVLTHENTPAVRHTTGRARISGAVAVRYADVSTPKVRFVGGPSRRGGGRDWAGGRGGSTEEDSCRIRGAARCPIDR